MTTIMVLTLVNVAILIVNVALMIQRRRRADDLDDPRLAAPLQEIANAIRGRSTP
jgi:hypothetical protein